jgi:hypothetical protein
VLEIRSAATFRDSGTRPSDCADAEDSPDKREIESRVSVGRLESMAHQDCYDLFPSGSHNFPECFMVRVGV